MIDPLNPSLTPHFDPPPLKERSMSSDTFLRRLNRIVDLLDLVRYQDTETQRAISLGCDPAFLILDFHAASSPGFPALHSVSYAGDIGPDWGLTTRVIFSVNSDFDVKAEVSWPSGNGSISESLARLAAHSEAVFKMSQVEAILNLSLIDLGGRSKQENVARGTIGEFAERAREEKSQMSKVLRGATP